jgi:hypothetical protein
MPNKTVKLALALCLALAMPAAAQQGSVDARQIARIKADVTKRGTGERAKVTVELRNKTAVKGYINRAGTDDFVVNDTVTNRETTISYSDVEKVSGPGLSPKAKMEIGLGIGLGIVIVVAALIGTHLPSGG